MTPENAALIRRVQARLRLLQPELATALLRSLDRIIEFLPEAQLVALLSGQVSVSDVLTTTLLTRAMIPYSRAIRAAVESSVRLTIPDLPRLVGQPVPQVVAIFNYLDPVVIDAIRALESTALDTLTTTVKEVTRAFVENGIRDGLGVPEMARGLRSVIGIAPHQERYVENLVKELRALDPAFKARVLRDRRFDKSILKAIKDGTPIPEKKIQQIADAYRRRFTAHNTQVVTRQTAIDAFKEGQRLAWHGAVENGYVDPATLWKRWVHSDIVVTPRPEHLALDGTEVPYDQAYPNGDMVAGFGAFGCQCSDQYFVKPVASVGAISRRIAGRRQQVAGVF